MVNVVKLVNGAEVAEPVVTTTMMSLRLLAKDGLEGMMALFDLRELCKDSNYQSANVDRLRRLGLVDSSGQVHAMVRNIVLSAVVNDGSEFKLQSPIA